MLFCSVPMFCLCLFSALRFDSVLRLSLDSASTMYVCCLDTVPRFCYDLPLCLESISVLRLGFFCANVPLFCLGASALLPLFSPVPLSRDFAVIIVCA